MIPQSKTARRLYGRFSLYWKPYFRKRGLLMNRILIIGSNGAGKSTFSFRLAGITGLPLVHIDQIYWRGDWDVTPVEEFDRLVQTEAQKSVWIIEGNNLRSLPQRLALADTVFWFEFPPALCVRNVLRRELRYRGRVRPDMPDQCVSRFDFSFLRMVWSFNRKNHGRIASMLNAQDHIRVIRFTNYRQAKAYLNRL